MPNQSEQIYPRDSSGQTYQGNIPALSLTDLGGLPGADEDLDETGSTFHVSDFLELKDIEPMPMPQQEQPLYLNNYQQTYTKMPIETFSSPDPTTKGFGDDNYNLVFKLLLILCLIAFIYYILKEMR
ncbi:MAG: hypothetical protein Barrevirus13_2 [Barrevirus sp.]|uniref:Uncharacterized protein n=1 Tax=Barrevirus sp. TaxID=2487763 RepID=A0A3G4ZU48_9VIRU|nr:MAG: hypothetical protein Barrevirus13_2 [Barrevirus sp.]